MTAHASALVEHMTRAAAGFLQSLADEQRAAAQFPFPGEPERRRWYYTPTQRAGLPLAEMTAPQQLLAHRLIASGLSVPGYATAATIMGLENVLASLEGWRMGGSYPGGARRAAPVTLNRHRHDVALLVAQSTSLYWQHLTSCDIRLRRTLAGLTGGGRRDDSRPV